ncbi:MAG: 50S ribosomal protein L17 [Blastocatellia bacterium]|nr:50S ribosomal protein L17 [Blastocatellia bacterium]
MRHLNAHRKLGRTSAHRKSLLRNLATSLILHERLVTTLPKAKELRPFVEKAITLGKRGDLHARRLAAGYFHAGNQDRIPDAHGERTAGVAAVRKLFDTIAARFSERNGGYTRIIKLGTRRGDGAEVAIIELIGSEYKPAAEESSAS